VKLPSGKQKWCRRLDLARQELGPQRVLCSSIRKSEITKEKVTISSEKNGGLGKKKRGRSGVSPLEQYERPFGIGGIKVET